jgi:hypothetical protein
MAFLSLTIFVECLVDGRHCAQGFLLIKTYLICLMEQVLLLSHYFTDEQSQCGSNVLKVTRIRSEPRVRLQASCL